MGDSNKNQKPSEMDKEDLPNVEAFNDEFTRNFLKSVEETEEEFYPFLSGTGKYKMDFPAGGVIDEISYFVRENDREEVHISIEDDMGFGMDVIYDSGRTKDRIENDLDRFKNRLGYDDDFDILEKKDRTIYYAQDEGKGFRDFFAYVLDAQGKGAVEVEYEIDCRNEKEEICKEKKKSDKERALKWIESVEFINGEEGENHE